MNVFNRKLHHHYSTAPLCNPPGGVLLSGSVVKCGMQQWIHIREHNSIHYTGIHLEHFRCTDSD